MNKTYPSDLTDNQWNHIKEEFETEKQRGRPIEIDHLNVVTVCVLPKLNVPLNVKLYDFRIYFDSCCSFITF